MIDWLTSLNWGVIVPVAIGIGIVICCVVGAWKTLVRNARRASE